MGIVTPKFLRKNRKFALVIVLSLSAIITPPDIVSQIIVSIPLLILYEVSIFIFKTHLPPIGERNAKKYHHEMKLSAVEIEKSYKGEKSSRQFLYLLNREKL